MKQKLTLVFILLSYFANSQDIVTKKDGIDIEVKVLEVLPSEIKYKKFDNLEGPTFTLLKNEILLIRYENGTKDIFNESINDAYLIEKQPQEIENLYLRGINDASMNYHGKNGGAGGTLITSLLSPIVGLIPAIACSASTPKDENLNLTNLELAQNVDYYRGYTSKAKKIKQKKIWTNWGIAFGVNVLFVLALQGS
ncbi:hypothetical protein SAMN06298216_4067 [Spirosomataceae bacterium TFI 002]|nr:hypothetical protein SAMN06298216_4067 [Spirosomataceae bacterium TFI 002]